MALSEARRASLLAYCRIEEPTAEELLTLEGLYDAAVGYLEQAGVSEPEEGPPPPGPVRPVRQLHGVAGLRLAGGHDHRHDCQ